MDEHLAKSIRRQLRAIKLMLGFFSLLLVAMLLILGFIAWKVVTFTQDVSNRITNIQEKTQQNLDLKEQICSNNSISGLLGQNNDFCR